MIHIHAEFKNIDEMLDFTRRLSGLAGVQAVKQEPLALPVQDQQPDQASSASVGVPTTQVSSVAPIVSQTAGVVPTMAQTYTSDDLARAAMALMDSGQQAALVELLKQFGVAALPELKPEQFGTFATALRGMGAPI